MIMIFLELFWPFSMIMIFFLLESLGRFSGPRRWIGCDFDGFVDANVVAFDGAGLVDNGAGLVGDAAGLVVDVGFLDVDVDVVVFDADVVVVDVVGLASAF
jgi:hypothetical protein